MSPSRRTTDGPTHRPTHSVDRLVDTLELLADAGRPLGVTELGESLGIHKATASRLLATMADRGLVRRDDDGYRLGPGLARLAVSAIADLDLVEVCRPVLRELVEVTGEVAYVATPIGRAVLYVEQVAPRQAVGEDPWVWLRGSPLHCSSSGKVFAAYGAVANLDAALEPPLPSRARRTISTPEAFRALLPQVRRQGFATSTDELEDGMTSVAAPVLGSSGAVLAAVGVAGPNDRLPSRRLPGLGASTVAAAASLGRRVSPLLGRPSTSQPHRHQTFT
ncbi:MAG: IclR family transcriptional regulator [Actinomycetes bacterium]